MNGQETEIKFHVKDLKEMQARLGQLGALCIQTRVHETNLRFDLPDGSLSAAGRVLRLRLDDAARLTYKGPSQAINGTRRRVEIEFTVGDHDSARQFLEALGYVASSTYEKFRTTYELPAAHVMLDELPYGGFVEIEADSVEVIHATADRLGLDWEAAVPLSYLEIHKRLSADLGLDAANLTFTTFEGIRADLSALSIRPAD